MTKLYKFIVFYRTKAKNKQKKLSIPLPSIPNAKKIYRFKSSTNSSALANVSGLPISISRNFSTRYPIKAAC